ncbi:CoB--CoM heterodisulfide reductase iron-sulfur subunit A family protein [Thiococcus pfennigii]|uniref:CoB--CoM heterodisulfide reductase iron-sulfur subunit A family protein n=1 Tax=Thiococcus pfennigii TaxID=1057 RepID=UPI001908FCF8|nr:CoB--CoM heterodisulfide reductase iron-sulfur subunit A family protein [Thiococcus pfennigii]MBK1730698.1 disulfide reductase [Thiococcus pfennigii]
MSKRTGVFVCHCGKNIAATVDVKKVARELAKDDGVVFCEDYVYMCSDPGQGAVIDAIKENDLDGMVISCCSPTLHEKTFRDASELGGLSGFRCEIANIREQCSWVHKDPDEATDKAIKISRAAVRRVQRNEPLDPIGVPVTRRALVVGGGIAGIQTALDLADAGLDVILVEKQSTIGGNMLKLSETFPTLDCSQCILSPKMVAVSKNPRIRLLTESEVESVSGFVGNFRVRIKKKAQYVDPELCKLCDDCSQVCPVAVPNEYDEGLTNRRAIFIPFAQAIPASFTLDEAACLGLKPVVCGKCEEVCEAGAIDFDKRPTVFEEEVGAIVVATGYDLYGMDKLGEYGAGRYADVLDGLQFERLCSASGATEGHILRPSDHKVPKEIVFIQCSGSRDPENHCAWCSKICCMYTAKHATLYKHHVPDGQAYVFYIDIRSGGKGYEEFVQRSMEKDGVIYLRGRVSRVYEQGGKLRVLGVDTLSGRNVEIAADMVVLAQAMEPSKGTAEIAKTLKIGLGKDGFLAEAHPKLKPVESVTAGIYLAGAAQGPKDIPETVAQASAAASKVIALLSKEELHHSPTVAKVRDPYCTGCAMCVDACPYEAIGLVGGKAAVNEVLCQGCGSCVGVCVRAAIDVKNVSQLQIHEMISAVLAA